MRSGNGRHRRPRQAPAIFVTAGVTGAGLALPLLSAGGAHAADTATWDKVAQCESGGVWSAASGNGFYGGLQLTQEMWDRHGGTAYASRPDLASRAQQIAVAETILDDRGPDAWPSCAVNAGLTKDGRAPEVDPGNTSTPLPDPADRDDSTGPTDSQDGADQGPSDEPSEATPSPSASHPGDSGDTTGAKDRTQEPSGSTMPGDDGDGTSGTGDPSHADDDPSRTGDPADSADPADGGSRTDTAGEAHREPTKGRHRGGPDDGKDDGTDRASGGRHASRGDDAHRTDPTGGDYTVRPGDSLSAIAQAQRLPGGWPALYERNEGVIGSDADLIQPGQLLDLGHDAG